MLANSSALSANQINLPHNLLKLTAAKWHFNDLQLGVCLQDVLHTSKTNKPPYTCFLLRDADSLWWKLDTYNRLYIVKQSVNNHLQIKTSWGMKTIKLESWDQTDPKSCWWIYPLIRERSNMSLLRSKTSVSNATKNNYDD